MIGRKDISGIAIAVEPISTPEDTQRFLRSIEQFLDEGFSLLPETYRVTETGKSLVYSVMLVKKS